MLNKVYESFLCILFVITLLLTDVTSAQPPQQRGHWSYPGSISNHLRQGHGVTNTQGMSLEQMETMHDNLHRSSNTSRSRIAPRSRIKLFRFFR